MLTDLPCLKVHVYYIQVQEAFCIFINAPTAQMFELLAMGARFGEFRTYIYLMNSMGSITLTKLM